jgi:hypothetical protein
VRNVLLRMTDHPMTRKDTPAWLFQVWASFVIATGGVLAGIYFLPVSAWVRGYMVMGTLFAIGSCFSLAKTLRDNFEIEKLVNKITEAKTDKILKDYERDTA